MEEQKKARQNTGGKIDVYQLVTDKLIEALEAGVIPWRKTWQNGYAQAMNYVSKRGYTGINALLTALTPYDSPYFLTFKQVKELGGSVKKGSKSIPLVFYKVSYYDTEGNEISEEVAKGMTKPNKKILLRYYRVFNAEDVTGIEFSPLATFHSPNNFIEEADVLMKEMPNLPKVEIGPPSYTPGTDTIRVPKISQFDSAGYYYHTFFHELIHATGHSSRLDRPEVMEIDVFGSSTYSQEELVAEIGAAYLCRFIGILETEMLENAASYIAHWLEKLKNDNRFVFRAARKAKEACQYILQ